MAVAPALGVAVVGLGLALGWRGTDVAAAMHRVLLFRRDGFSLWDNSWYGGEWTLDYSVLFAPVAATLGLPALGLLAAGVSSLCFERLVTPSFGRAGQVGAVVFALGMVVQTAIGQYPFLAGEAPALACLWAASRSRWPAAWALALLASALSPLAGAFAALGALAWLLAEGRRQGWRPTLDAAGIVAAAAAPVLVTAALFPGEGPMPFQGINWLWDVAVAAGIGMLTPRHHRVLRVGVGLYLVVLAGSFFLQTPVGVNAGRLEDAVALPLAVTLLWPRRRLLLALVAVPLFLSEWQPAFGAMTTVPGEPSAHARFYAPLDAFLERVDPAGRDGRVEVVPGADHGESEWVADVEPLARGWERQTDMADNPLFYRPHALDDATYRAWLADNGVRYVALPAAPLDFAAVDEGRLLDAGVPGLRLVWHDADWKVWEVTFGSGLVDGGASVVRLGAADVVLRVPRPEAVTLRVRWNDDWTVTEGRACVAEAPGGWTTLRALRPGRVRIAVRLFAGGPRCARSR